MKRKRRTRKNTKKRKTHNKNKKSDMRFDLSTILYISPDIFADTKLRHPFRVSFFNSVIMGKEDKNRPSESFVLSVVAIVFLIIGYQTAMFVYRAAVLKIEANRDCPDTVYICQDRSDSHIGQHEEQRKVVRKNAEHSPRVKAVRQNISKRRVESFLFDPNTVSHDDLCRLGFTPKQAQSIVSYREKGGRFRRKSDFAKSYVVADSVYLRLEKYIDIPLLDLNLADSADFDALPGIGGWFAAKMVAHRKALKGYSYKEQLMDIWKFDKEKYDALQDLVTVSEQTVIPYPLWFYPADSLKGHPYIRNYETARAIVLFRESSPKSDWTVENLSAAGIISSDNAAKLSRCVILQP